ncbi:hypothetical protein JHK85_045517 [Glycine max]|nr:hypothetical protein JHK85_045517 [Glycine max]
MSSFSITRKKTPFQKHREEEEAKKKRAEDETARLYAEFVESFQGDTTPGSKTFVRGGTINPNDKFKDDSEGEKSKDGVSGPKKGSRSAFQMFVFSKLRGHVKVHRDEGCPLHARFIELLQVLDTK